MDFFPLKAWKNTFKEKNIVRKEGRRNSQEQYSFGNSIKLQICQAQC